VVDDRGQKDRRIPKKIELAGFFDPATAVSLTPTGLGLGGQKDSAANGYH
jgi:hypothetical protein